MAQRKAVPDSVQASLDHDLAVILASFVEESDEYDNYADFVRDALWDKLRDEHGTPDVLEYHIQLQKERVEQTRLEKIGAERNYEREKERLEQFEDELDDSVHEEADQFWDDLEDAEPGR